MAFNKDDVIESTKKFGPKQKGKVSIFVSQNRTSKDATGKEVIDTRKPSLFGYMTDNDMNMFSITLWKNKDAKKDRDGKIITDKDGNTVYKITFKGNAESLGIKQNVVEIKPSNQEKDSLDDVFS